MVANPKRGCLRDKKYIKSFKIEGEHQCLITGVDFPDGAHVRYGWLAAGNKPPDNYIIPLAHHLHARQHMMGEAHFWEVYNSSIPSDIWERAGDTCDVPKGGTDEEHLMAMIIQIANNYYDDWRVRG